MIHGMPLEVMARENLHLSGDAHCLVNFLNRTLKTRGLIFGLTRDQNTREYVLTIYYDPASDYERGSNPASLRARASGDKEECDGYPGEENRPEEERGSG